MADNDDVDVSLVFLTVDEKNQISEAARQADDMMDTEFVQLTPF